MQERYFSSEKGLAELPKLEPSPETVKKSRKAGHSNPPSPGKGANKPNFNALLKKTPSIVIERTKTVESHSQDAPQNEKLAQKPNLTKAKSTFTGKPKEKRSPQNKPYRKSVVLSSGKDSNESLRTSDFSAKGKPGIPSFWNLKILEQKNIALPDGKKTIIHTEVDIKHFSEKKAEKIWQLFDKSTAPVEELKLHGHLIKYEKLYRELNKFLFRKKGAFSYTPPIIEHGLVNAILTLPYSLEEYHKNHTQFLIFVYASTSAIAYSLSAYARNMNIKLSVMNNKYEALNDLLKVGSQLQLLSYKKNQIEVSEELHNVELICLQVWAAVIKEFKLSGLNNFNVNDVAECHVNMMIALIQYLTSCKESNDENQGLYQLNNFSYDGLELPLIITFSKIITKHIYSTNFVKNLATFNYPYRLHFSKIPGHSAFILAIMQIHKRHQKISSAPTLPDINEFSEGDKNHLLEKIFKVEQLIGKFGITKIDDFKNVGNLRESGTFKNNPPNQRLSAIMSSISDKIYKQVGVERRFKTPPYAFTFLSYYIQGLQVFRTINSDQHEPSSGSIIAVFNFICMTLVNGFKKLQAWMLSNNEKFEQEYKTFKSNLEDLYGNKAMKVSKKTHNTTLTPSFKTVQFIIASAWEKVLKNKKIDEVFSADNQVLITLRMFNPMIEFLLRYEAEKGRQLSIPKSKVDNLIKLFVKEIEAICSERAFDKIKHLTFKTVVIKDLSSSTILTHLQEELGGKLGLYLKDTTPNATRRFDPSKPQLELKKNESILSAEKDLTSIKNELFSSLDSNQQRLFNIIMKDKELSGKQQQIKPSLLTTASNKISPEIKSDPTVDSGNLTTSYFRHMILPTILTKDATLKNSNSL